MRRKCPDGHLDHTLASAIDTVNHVTQGTTTQADCRGKVGDQKRREHTGPYHEERSRDLPPLSKIPTVQAIFHLPVRSTDQFGATIG